MVTLIMWLILKAYLKCAELKLGGIAEGTALNIK